MRDIELLDTTIRDGELSPLFSPTAEERLEIAKSLESAGVDVIELASTATGFGLPCLNGGLG